MKKIFTILSIALMALCSTALVSCGSDDDSTSGNNDQDKKTTINADVTLYVVVTAKQADYFDQSYNININGTTKSVSLSEMTQVKDSATMKSLVIFDDVQNPVGMGNSEFKFYSYNCGKMSQGSICVENMNCKLKANHPKDILYFYSAATFVPTQDGKVLSTDYYSLSKLHAVQLAGCDASDEDNLVKVMSGLEKYSQATLTFK